MQGATVRWIRDQALKNSATDGRGNRIVSSPALNSAIQKLDHDGRLQFIFGKKGAQQMRDINDLAKYSRTVPPEAAINHSNTATTMLSAFADIGASTFTGLPVPIATGLRLAIRRIGDTKLRKRIEDALKG